MLSEMLLNVRDAVGSGIPLLSGDILKYIVVRFDSCWAYW